MLSALNFGEVSIQLSPSNLIFRVPLPCHWNVPLRTCSSFESVGCLHMSYKNNSLVTGCVMLVIAQWYNCSITSFFLLKMRLKILKNDCNQIQISVFEKGLHFREHFYSSSEQVSTSSKL